MRATTKISFFAYEKSSGGSLRLKLDHPAGGGGNLSPLKLDRLRFPF